MNNREKPRFLFPEGYRPIVKYRLVSTTTSVPDSIIDGVMIDLSEDGASFQGALPDQFIFELGNGIIQLGCNLYLNQTIYKVLANVRWFKTLTPGQFQFGVQFQLTDKMRLDIQRFLIRHQIDTRRFRRSAP